MKKRLAILGMSCIMLFSGLSVYAATGECRHPSSTRYYGQQKEKATCSVSGCVAYRVFNVTADVCNYCGVTLKQEKVYSHTEHSEAH